MAYTLEQLQKMGAKPVDAPTKSYTAEELQQLGAKPVPQTPILAKENQVGPSNSASNPGLYPAVAKMLGKQQQPVQPSFPATGYEGPGMGTAKTIGNIPSSAGALFQGAQQMAQHPIKTLQGLGSAGLGAGASAVKAATGYQIPGSEKDVTAFQGMQEFSNKRFGTAFGEKKFDADTMLRTLQKTASNDPVGFGADALTLLEGGAGGIDALRGTTGLNRARQAAEASFTGIPASNIRAMPVVGPGKTAEALNNTLSSAARVVTETAPNKAKAVGQSISEANKARIASDQALATADAQAKRTVIHEQRAQDLHDIDNSYSKGRKATNYSKDEGAGSYQRVAETDVVVDSVGTDGMMRTKQKGGAVDQYRAQVGLDESEATVRQNLERLRESIDPVALENHLKANIENNPLIQGEAKELAKRRIEREVAAYKRDSNGRIQLTQVHDAKIATTKDVGDFATPAETKTYKKSLGNGLKTAIEDNSSFNVKEVNAELSKYYEDIELLRRLDGARVQGGRLGGHFARIGGQIVGAGVGAALSPVLGPMAVPAASAMGGEVAGFMKGKSMSGTFGKRTGNVAPQNPILEKAVQTGNSPRPVQPAPLALPKPKPPAVIELPGKGILEGQQKLRESLAPTKPQSLLTRTKNTKSDISRVPKSDASIPQGLLSKDKQVKAEVKKPVLDKTKIVSQVIKDGPDTLTPSVTRKEIRETITRQATKDGVKFNPDGTVTLYHGTPNSAAINKSGTFKEGTYFGANRSLIEKQYSGQSSSKAGQKFTIMETKVDPADLFYNGDGVFVARTSEIKPTSKTPVLGKDKQVSKTPINRPPEAESALKKMNDAFEEVNDQAGKTGKVDSAKFREANKLADDYWKLRDKLDSLTQEASKYKSAEEFADDLTSASLDWEAPTIKGIYYHGDAFPEGGAMKVRSGLSLTPESTFAKQYANRAGGDGAVVRPFQLKTEAKVFDAMSKGRVDGEAMTQIIGEAKSEGYDAVRFKTTSPSGLGSGEELYVINPKSVQEFTKSQLTDIYNKATGKGLLDKSNQIKK